MLFSVQFTYWMSSKLNTFLSYTIGTLDITAVSSVATSFPGSLFFPSPGARKGETLAWSCYVRPKIWDVANKRFVGGADECDIRRYLVQGRAKSVAISRSRGRKEERP